MNTNSPRIDKADGSGRSHGTDRTGRPHRPEPHEGDGTDRPHRPDRAGRPHEADGTDRPHRPGPVDISLEIDAAIRPTHRLPDWADTKAILLIALAATVLALFWWWSGRAETGTVVESPATQPPAQVAIATGPSPEEGTAATMSSQAPTNQPLDLGDQGGVAVDVRGGVRDRGVHVLPTGSRVIDAIEAAGGLRPGRTYGSLNLAEILTDGQQIIVSRNGQPAGTGPPDPGRAPSQDAGGEPVNLNTATPVQLESLPGVGPVLAERIVAWRTEHGGFTTVDDLLDVSGIGDKVLAGLRDGATV